MNGSPSQAPARRLAIDVATGNGQAAVALAPYFDRVIATEPSAAQLREARAHPGVEYRQEAAEAIAVESGTADLLTAAQAAHWFDWPRFCAEAARVLRPGGVLAVWSYGDCRVGPAIDRLVARFLARRRRTRTGRASAVTSRRPIATSCCHFH